MVFHKLNICNECFSAPFYDDGFFTIYEKLRIFIVFSTTVRENYLLKGVAYKPRRKLRGRGLLKYLHYLITSI